MKIQLTKDRLIGTGEKPYIIAELGSNHNGDMNLARRLIDAAKACGADCVKFQSWSKETIFSKKVYKQNYFLADDYRSRTDTNLEKIVENYAISKAELLEMKQYAEQVGIDCASTPFSKGEVDFLVDEFDVDFIKVASMDLNNYQFLHYVASKGKPIILSTGLSTLGEIDKAVRTIENAGNVQLVLLHCVAIYPPEDNQMNLKSIDTLARCYPYPVGFSDHTAGTCLPIAAVARGACLVEKHFTLDRKMDGWDHAMSADIDDMTDLVKSAERVFQAMGSGRVDRVESDERLHAFRRSIVAARDVGEGEIFTEDMIDFKRPGDGLPPETISAILGKSARRDIPYDQMLKFEDY
ncbi:N-acetylneuraminate synthase family protein [Litorivicinus sp.]|nr:N-acetylneuraminate synthase family protein [Litorivicinus sp.]MDC1239983.1 N-acetylneuraminate synthase family protein [Litorivicinus sp.]